MYQKLIETYSYDIRKLHTQHNALLNWGYEKTALLTVYDKLPIEFIFYEGAVISYTIVTTGALGFAAGAVIFEKSFPAMCAASVTRSTPVIITVPAWHGR